MFIFQNIYRKSKLISGNITTIFNDFLHCSGRKHNILPKSINEHNFLLLSFMFSFTHTFPTYWRILYQFREFSILPHLVQSHPDWRFIRHDEMIFIEIFWKQIGILCTMSHFYEKFENLDLSKFLAGNFYSIQISLLDPKLIRIDFNIPRIPWFFKSSCP